MKYFTPPIDMVCIRLHTSQCTIFKGLVTRLPPRSEIQPYVVYLQHMLHKVMRMKDKKFCQGSWHSPYFEAYEHPLFLYGQSNDAKTRAHHLPLEIALSWPHLLRAHLQNLFHISCLPKTQLQWLHSHKILQYIRLGWIGPSIFTTQVCSLRANWDAIWTRGAHFAYEFGWFYLSRLLSQWWITF